MQNWIHFVNDLFDSTTYVSQRAVSCGQISHGILYKSIVWIDVGLCVQHPVTLFHRPPPQIRKVNVRQTWKDHHIFSRVGGYSYVKVGKVPQKLVTFSPEILKHRSCFCKKNKTKQNIEEVDPISQTLQKYSKISPFWSGKNP